MLGIELFHIPSRAVISGFHLHAVAQHSAHDLTIKLRLKIVERVSSTLGYIPDENLSLAKENLNGIWFPLPSKADCNAPQFIPLFLQFNLSVTRFRASSGGA